MIGLETAKKLKEAGLKWEPPLLGDAFYFEDGYKWDVLSLNDIKKYNEYKYAFTEEVLDYIEDGTWIYAPRLDQMITAIDGRKYWWNLIHSFTDETGKKYKFEVSKKYVANVFNRFIADSPEEATAQALIWILQQESSDS